MDAAVTLSVEGTALGGKGWGAARTWAPSTAPRWQAVSGHQFKDGCAEEMEGRRGRPWMMKSEEATHNLMSVRISRGTYEIL